MDEERYFQSIRDQAKELADAEIEVAKTEARLKQLTAMRKVDAAAKGVKTDAAQSTYVDTLDEIFEARLEVGKAKARQVAAKTELKAREVAFEQWKAELYQANREARRYGA